MVKKQTKLRKKFSYFSQYIYFLHGMGLSKVDKHVNRLKKYLKLHKEKNLKNTLLLIRLEMWQIKKHQKLTMRYLNRFEKLVNKDTK